MSFRHTITGWLAQHWRGQAPVGVLTGVNLIAVTAVLWVFIGFAPLPVALVGAGIAVATACWQAVGTVRALDRFLAHAGGLLTTVGLLGLLLVTTVVLADRSVTRVSQVFLDPALGAYVPPPAQVAVTGDTLSLTGEISYEALAQFDAALTPAVGRVELRSPGGNVHAARVMAGRIISAGLATHATGDCLSACTLVFAAGRARTLADGAQLGFHGYAVFGQMRSGLADIPAEEARDKAYLSARGVDRGFVDRAYATSHADIWMPARDALLAAGMITGGTAD